MNSPEPPLANSDLSEREKEIALLIAAGLTEEQIASRLFISPFTVHTHRKNIYKKLGVHCNTELVLELIRRGILKGIVAH